MGNAFGTCLDDYKQRKTEKLFVQQLVDLSLHRSHLNDQLELFHDHLETERSKLQNILLQCAIEQGLDTSKDGWLEQIDAGQQQSLGNIHIAIERWNGEITIWTDSIRAIDRKVKDLNKMKLGNDIARRFKALSNLSGALTKDIDSGIEAFDEITEQTDEVTGLFDAMNDNQEEEMTDCRSDPVLANEERTKLNKKGMASMVSKMMKTTNLTSKQLRAELGKKVQSLRTPANATHGNGDNNNEVGFEMNRSGGGILGRVRQHAPTKYSMLT